MVGSSAFFGKIFHDGKDESFYKDVIIGSKFKNGEIFEILFKGLIDDNIHNRKILSEKGENFNLMIILNLIGIIILIIGYYYD